MPNTDQTAKTLLAVQSFINQFPLINYGANAIPHLNIEGYGAGQVAYNQLKTDFDALEFSKVTKAATLPAAIKKQEKELEELEKKYSSLVSVFGEDGGASEGTLTHKLIKVLEQEVEELIKKRDSLQKDVSEIEVESKAKIAAINIKVNEAEANANNQIKNAVNTASGKVRLINQFSDFLSETNKNMTIYYWVILFLSFGSILTVALSVPELLKCFDSYDTYVNGLLGSKAPWQILNYAFGILIVKLPWALCLSAVFTGIYKLLKGLLTTYEKINQDKRNISAIYAVSGNIAENLNEYGLSIAIHDNEDDDTGEMYTVLRAPNKEIKQKRESLKWNQIMNYFERMQHHKEDVIEKEDESKLKLVTDLLKTVIEKLPKTS